MNVLQLLSQMGVTGAESYAINLGEWLSSQGHQVTLISNTIHLPTDLPFISREIHTNSSLTRFKNVLFLRKFIQENNIQIVHAHSRAAVRVAYWATRGLKVALISSVHGRQHSSFSKKIHDIYGDRVIAVCPNVAESLKSDFAMSPRKIKVIGNPVNPNDYSFVETLTPQKKIALIGRLNGPKGLLAKAFILNSAPVLLKVFPDLEIEIVGDSLAQLGPEFKQQFLQMSEEHQDRIRFLEFIPDLHKKLSDYQLVLGAGRIAISSLMRGIPLYALGEYGSEGPVTPENYETAKASNFGDMGARELSRPVDFIQLTEDLKRLLQISFPLEQRWNLRDKTLKDFSLHEVCEEILDLYKSAYFQKQRPQNIPVLMYHKIPDQDISSRHRIFVNKNNFERHLQFFKDQGFTTLHFSEIEEYRSLKKDPATFPKKPLVLTFDDGYIDNLKNAGPLLQKYGHKAVIYLLADNDVRYNYWDADSGDSRSDIMSPEQKQELLNYTFEVGSHGLRHDKITEMSDERAWQELTESKSKLEQQFKRPVVSYAFTYGITSPKHAQMAQKAGYDFAVNTDTGGLHFEENPFSIFRANIFPEDGPAQLKKKTATWYRKYYYWKRKK
ncbi:Polysaccharide deacetylase [compost metagenome]